MAFIPETHTLPIYWACYLINGDADGLSDEEIAHIDTYTEGLGSCVTVEDESYFTNSYDIHSGGYPEGVTGGEVADYTFLRQI